MKRAIILIFLAVALSVSAQEKSESQKDYYWMDAGLGSDNFGRGPFLAVNYRHKSILYRIRYIRSAEKSFFVPNPRENLNDIGFMLGGTYSGKYMQLAASGGLGCVTGVFRYDWSSEIRNYERSHFFTAGIPLELSCHFQPIQYFGVGLGLYSNINRAKSIYGISVNVQVGLLP